jgi:hypothetical protein
MLILDFEGYFQMRMATDPDPTDGKRGISGYTFALAGEPDLDANIHLQPDEDGVWERKFGPPGTPGPCVGVKVANAKRNNAAAPELVGTRIAFVDAQILEHNGLLVRNDLFIIHMQAQIERRYMAPIARRRCDRYSQQFCAIFLAGAGRAIIICVGCLQQQTTAQQACPPNPAFHIFTV